jgi:hypothetical protein
MPFEIGNIFGSKSRRSAPVEHSQAESTGTLVGARLTLGRANKALETKTDELKASQVRLSELDLAIGQTLADDGDASADIQERQSLQSRIQQLESATAVLRQRKQDAENAVTKTERAAKEDAKVAALARLKAVGVKVDQLLVALEHLVNEEIMPGIDEVRSAVGNQNFIIVLQLEFERLLLYAVRRLVPKGNVAGRCLLYDKWSDAIPDPESARTRPRDD